ncbi:MAG: radical SAM protein [Planctomycetes bacterium]|nr:radical SAM protein [Planctomycetota bacterium]
MDNVVKLKWQEDLATLYLGEFRKDGDPNAEPDVIEFVESRQPPKTKAEKWVLIISTMAGCPVKCKFCDAGSYFRRNLTSAEIIEQVDYLVSEHYPDWHVPAKQFKIHFARMGDPILNNDMLEVLRVLPGRYNAPGLFPSLSSAGPWADTCVKWIEEVKTIKDELYGRNFQFQFSLHTTNEKRRRELIPVKTMPFEMMADLGAKLFTKGDRKITLNFALMKDVEVEPAVVAKYFDPEYFYVKMTPLNPTRKAADNDLESAITEEDLSFAWELRDGFRAYGFDSDLSWGDSEENRLETNCGQYATEVQERRGQRALVAATV